MEEAAQPVKFPGDGEQSRTLLSTLQCLDSLSQQFQKPYQWGNKQTMEYQHFSFGIPNVSVGSGRARWPGTLGAMASCLWRLPSYMGEAIGPKGIKAH